VTGSSFGPKQGGQSKSGGFQTSREGNREKNDRQFGAIPADPHDLAEHHMEDRA
jgi:hypothetical protein